MPHSAKPVGPIVLAQAESDRIMWMDKGQVAFKWGKMVLFFEDKAEFDTFFGMMADGYAALAKSGVAAGTKPSGEIVPLFK